MQTRTYIHPKDLALQKSLGALIYLINCLMSILTIQKTALLSICPSRSTHINMLMIAIRMRQYDCSSNMQDIIDKINDWAPGNKTELNSKNLRQKIGGFALKKIFLNLLYLQMVMI